MTEPPINRWPRRVSYFAAIVTLGTWASAAVALWLTSSAWLTAAVIGTVLSFVLGIAVLQFKDRAPWQRACAHAGLWTGFLGAFSALFLPACGSLRNAATKMRSYNNLQQIAFAMREYESANGHLPAVAIRATDGTPLLSWRVALLPFLDEKELYDQFRLNEPWDGPHNHELLPRMPKCYRVGGAIPRESTDTFFQVLIGKGTAFERDGLRLSQDFPDGLSDTILVVDACVAVPWTKPEDIIVDETPLLPKLGYWTHRKHFYFEPTSKDGFIAAMADASSRGTWPPVSEEHVRAWATRNGGEPLPKD